MPACSQITLTPVTVTSTGMTASNVDGVYDLTTASPAFTSLSSIALGKNTIYYASAAPGGSGYAVGDTWFDTAHGNAIYKWSGSAWVAVQFGSAAFAGGSVDLAALASGAVDASKLVSGAVTSSAISAGAVGATQLAANSVVAGKIAASAVTATEIAAGTITSSNIAAGAIAAGNIAAGAITSSHISTGAITAGMIAVGTLAAGMTASGTFYCTDISTSSLSATSTCYFYGGATVATGTTFTANGPAVFGNTVNVGGISAIASGTTAVVDGSNYLRKLSSSARYKQDIVPIEDVPELDPARLLDIPVRAYHFKPGYLQDDDPNLDVFTTGLIAEDVEAHYPVAALYSPDGEGGFQVENWAERQIIPGMLALIQRQHAEIAALTARIEALESI